MERISSRPGDMGPHHEVVVIGSGYGGAVMASRLARAGRDVCLLERGEERRPGEFPDTALGASAEVQVHTPRHDVGRRQGLFELHVDEDINVVKGCGLGGTSLINANVALRPDPRVFDDPRWPQALRDDLDGLHRAMDRAEVVLGSTPYPQERTPLAKTAMLERQAAALGWDFALPPINVTFEAGPNAVGIHQPACDGCGDCVTGCNVGAKNTLMMNYLPDARRWGAAIFTGVDVRAVERSADVWAVRYELVGAGRERFGVDELTVCADLVVLAGGTLGSTEILLRSAARGLAVSPQVGRHFSGNADVLGFAFDCDDEVNGIGWGADRSGRPLVGPCITGVIDGRDGVPVDDGLIIEEGAIPSALASVVPASFALGEPSSDGETVLARLRQSVASLVAGAHRGPASRTQTFLVMGSEPSAGSMDLEGDRLRIRWPGVGRSALFEEVDHVLAHATSAVGGDYVPNPEWKDLVDHPLVTVHPLGGCPMGDRAETGAVDHTGAVFAGASGTDVHPGLYVCDGAVVPRPLGANPLLTITALAERTAALVAEAHGWIIDDSAAPPTEAEALPTDLLVEFTERMAGWVSPGETDPIRGAAAGEAAGHELWYELSMSGPARLLAAEPSRPTNALGVVGCPALSDEPLAVEQGYFRLFVPDGGGSEDSRMIYEVPLRTTDGRRFHLSGFKTIDRGGPGALWRGTTTLYTTVHHDGPDGPVWGSGIIRISAPDFARQLSTMRVTGPAPAVERLAALTAYGRMFAGRLFDYYGGPLGWSHLPHVDGGPAGPDDHRRPPAGTRDDGRAGGAGLCLDEEMVGSWSPTGSADAADAGDREQYLAAAAAGAEAGRTMDLRLTLATTDVEGLIHDLSAPLAVSGTVEVDGLFDGPAAVGPAGTMSLVVADDAVDVHVQHMRYHLPLPEVGLHLEGFKVLTDGDLTQLWGAATTLHVTIHREGPDGEVLGRGVARISPEGFARQLSTIEITGEPSEARRLALMARFGAAFAGALWDDYGTVVHRSTRLRRDAPPRPHRPLDVPAREVHAYRTSDGVDLRLTRHRGGSRGPVVLVHGMGANPSTFTLDTVQPNLLEHLVAEGFDVWLQEWRGSTALPSARTQFDADQVASLDHPAAAAAIRAVTGRDDLHLVTHCVGSITWMMSLLAGWTTPTSALFSQVGAHPVGPGAMKLKAGLRLPTVLRRLGVRLMTTDSYDDESLGARAVDLALLAYPIPREERCDSAVCRRLAFIYGLAIHHAAVDEASHEALHELFGVTDLTMMEHLARCAGAERLVTARGADAYLPHVERARLPMTFVSGAHNGVWLPESTRRDHDWLVAAHGPDLARRVVLDGHGHQDTFMGAESPRDAFPVVVDHLERAGC